MEPNFERSSLAAAEVFDRFSSADPLAILKKLRGVLLISHEAESDDSLEGIDQDAVTLVDRVNGRLRYIVLYNSCLPAARLRFALARELGHVILKHDGSAPEDVWMEEANCFAYHLISHPVRPFTIFYRPNSSVVSASFKAMQIFSSIDDLKQFIADEQTRISRFVGRSVVYSPADIEIQSLDRKDVFAGWKNYSSVSVAGRPVGYCGE